MKGVLVICVIILGGFRYMKYEFQIKRRERKIEIERNI